ncbi:unnamed protein product [Protopolystoma xenopodis]|uniref:Uncharacterized protein n=1 Tax=Protopolystoma xenopodis TaxID=117903 RepID=A0A3S5BME7_9PLAT|nr:unnamed protein product [Protopolystoma xenopodis]
MEFRCQSSKYGSAKPTSDLDSVKTKFWLPGSFGHFDPLIDTKNQHGIVNTSNGPCLKNEIGEQNGPNEYYDAKYKRLAGDESTNYDEVGQEQRHVENEKEDEEDDFDEGEDTEEEDEDFEDEGGDEIYGEDRELLPFDRMNQAPDKNEVALRNDDIRHADSDGTLAKLAPRLEEPLLFCSKRPSLDCLCQLQLQGDQVAAAIAYVQASPSDTLNPLNSALVDAATPASVTVEDTEDESKRVSRAELLAVQHQTALDATLAETSRRLLALICLAKGVEFRLQMILDSK